MYSDNNNIKKQIMTTKVQTQKLSTETQNLFVELVTINLKSYKKVSLNMISNTIKFYSNMIAFNNVYDNYLITLGYKLSDISKYDYIEANKQPRQLISISGHEGAHAYMMTKRTAQNLIWEIEQKGILGAVDNAYFIRGQRKTAIPLVIMSPTPAIGYLRDSTIWDESAHVNYEFIDSFANYYK